MPRPRLKCLCTNSVSFLIYECNNIDEDLWRNAVFFAYALIKNVPMFLLERLSLSICRSFIDYIVYSFNTSIFPSSDHTRARLFPNNIKFTEFFKRE